MELNSSNKRTEIGIIAQDWDVITLGEIGKALIGLTYSPTQVRSSGTLVLRSSNIQDGRLCFDDSVYVDMSIPDKIMVKNGDILICVRNGSRNLIGKSLLLDERTKGATFGAFMAVFRAPHSKYIHHQIQSGTIKRQINQHLGATINQITNRSLNSFLIPLPPTKAEQEAIAEALSDADAYIESLQKLIAKKRLIKQGAMLELLTGKRRLPGYSKDSGYKQTELGIIPEDWMVSKLGYICGRVTTGKLDANAMIPDGPYRFYTCAKAISRIDAYAFDTEALLVSGNGANVGYIHYYKGKFNAYQRTYVLSEFNASIKFIQYYLGQRLAERIRVEVNAGNTPYITMGTLTDMLIAMPESYLEQKAIAEVITSLNDEIAAIEDKLEKSLRVKQGMMQKLLTGRIRLV
jgi:type I restriction enzyme, S subunit